MQITVGKIIACLSLGLGATLVACTNSGEEGSPSSPDYYPLSVGDYWEYEEIVSQGDSFGSTIAHYEVTRIETMDLGFGKGEREVLVIEKTYADISDERLVFYLEDDGTRVVRHRCDLHDENGDITLILDYVPGYPVFDRGRTEVGDEWTTEYTRHVLHLPGGDSWEEQWEEWFEILAIDQEVTIPVGTFECLEIERTEVSFPDSTPHYYIKTYYYAPEVGYVQSIDEYSVREYLNDYWVSGQ